MAGLVPATPLAVARPCHVIGVAGTSPAMTEWVYFTRTRVHATSRTSRQLPFGEGNVAQRARCEQLLELDAARGEAVLVGVLQQRLDALAVLADAVGEPVRPDDRALLFEQRLQPR